MKKTKAGMEFLGYKPGDLIHDFELPENVHKWQILGYLVDFDVAEWDVNAPKVVEEVMVEEPKKKSKRTVGEVVDDFLDDGKLNKSNKSKSRRKRG